MEKGEIRFHGPTAELLDRPDVLRSVFLEGAGAAVDARGATAHGRPRVSIDERRPQRRSRRATVLETVELTRSFGGIRAVDDVDLRVQPGEILGLIGPNGAGKTTLFDLVTGFTAGRRRSVILDGHDITGWRRSNGPARGLGRSFQDARLFPSLTVAETMAVALERDDRGPQRARGDALPPQRPRLRGEGPAPGRRADRAARARRVPVTSSSGNCRPGRAASSTSPASSPTRPRSCCSTSRRAASPSARPRRSPRCSRASATSSAPRARDRARHAAGLRHRRPHRRARSGSRDRRRDRRPCAASPRGRGVVPRNQRGRHRPIGGTAQLTTSDHTRIRPPRGNDMTDGDEADFSRQLRRWGPLGAIARDRHHRGGRALRLRR